jgi:hypothetical protein
MNRLWLAIGAVMAGATLGNVALVAQTYAGEKIDVSKLGPQVGEPVPDFNLRDQAGRSRDLKSILGSKGGMLVFVRSADW